MDEAMKTYDGWLRSGRVVRKGERADYYLVNPEGTASRAVFTEAQTDCFEDVDDTKDWTTVVPAAARPTKRDKDPRPKVIVEYTTGSNMMAVWVGANTKAIKQLQAGDFLYNPRTHRWVAQREGVDKTYSGLTKNGFRVEAYQDGKPWGPSI